MDSTYFMIFYPDPSTTEMQPCPVQLSLILFSHHATSVASTRYFIRLLYELLSYEIMLINILILRTTHVCHIHTWRSQRTNLHGNSGIFNFKC